MWAFMCAHVYGETKNETGHSHIESTDVDFFDRYRMITKIGFLSLTGHRLREFLP